jgi:hypothetical protein
MPFDLPELRRNGASAGQLVRYGGTMLIYRIFTTRCFVLLLDHRFFRLADLGAGVQSDIDYDHRLDAKGMSR